MGIAYNNVNPYTGNVRAQNGSDETRLSPVLKQLIIFVHLLSILMCWQ